MGNIIMAKGCKTKIPDVETPTYGTKFEDIQKRAASRKLGPRQKVGAIIESAFTQEFIDVDEPVSSMIDTTMTDAFSDIPDAIKKDDVRQLGSRVISGAK